MAPNEVQKIREWVKARLDENASKQSLPQFYGMMEEDARFLDFIDTLLKEPLSEDLEEAVNAYIGYAPEVDECSSVYGKRKAFRAGANWQRSQLMRNAFETAIVDDWQYGKDADHTAIPAIHQRIEGYKVGQKVKIVVIPKRLNNGTE